jgi:hypothetical protein
MEIIECACGCGNLIERVDSRGRLRRFIHKHGHSKGPIIPTEIRFWSKVNKTEGCWLWEACVNSWGYGQFKLNGKQKQAQRVSWMLNFGPIPEGMEVLHKCDNPPCVRPDHLFLGSQDDNMKDKNYKNRQAFGERQGSAKLTEDQIRLIRVSNKSSITLGLEYNVSESTIVRIKSRKTWRHVA